MYSSTLTTRRPSFGFPQEPLIVPSRFVKWYKIWWIQQPSNKSLAAVIGAVINYPEDPFRRTVKILIHHIVYEQIMLRGETTFQEVQCLQGPGFNLVKHCLYIPQDTYLTVGDELGMVQWLEMPMWLPSGSKAFCRRAFREFPRIAAALQHHPSLTLYSLGCELDYRVEARFLGRLYRNVRKRIPNALLCDNSVSGDCYGWPETGLSSFSDYHFYA